VSFKEIFQNLNEEKLSQTTKFEKFIFSEFKFLPLLNEISKQNNFSGKIFWKLISKFFWRIFCESFFLSHSHKKISRSIKFKFFSDKNNFRNFKIQNIFSSCYSHINTKILNKESFTLPKKNYLRILRILNLCSSHNKEIFLKFFWLIT